MARPHKETARHSSAWEYWYVLGADRSIAEVANRFQCSVQAVNGWRSAFSWDRKLADRERTVSSLVAQKSVEDEAQCRANDLKITRAAIYNFASTLQPIKDKDGNIISPAIAEIGASDFVSLVKLEQLLRGHADSRSEVIAGPAFAALIERLIGVIEREVQDPALRARIAQGFQDASFGVDAPANA